MHSPNYRWLSEKVKETSRQTRSVWRNCTPTSGNVSEAAKDAIGIVKENKQFSCSTGKHVAEAHECASKLDLRAGNVRKACLSFPSKKAIGPRPAHVYRHRIPPR